MKSKILKIPFLFCLILFGFNSEMPFTHIQDLKGNWNGTLTYTDYQDDVSRYTLNCKMNVKVKKNSACLKIAFTEPNGTIVYDKVKLKILKSGNEVKLDGQEYRVKMFKKDKKSKGWELIIQSRSTDNNKQAIILQRINYSPSKLSIAKEIDYEDGSKIIQRNKFEFKRN